MPSFNNPPMPRNHTVTMDLGYDEDSSILIVFRTSIETLVAIRLVGPAGQILEQPPHELFFAGNNLPQVCFDIQHDHLAIELTRNISEYHLIQLFESARDFILNNHKSLIGSAPQILAVQQFVNFPWVYHIDWELRYNLNEDIYKLPLSFLYGQMKSDLTRTLQNYLDGESDGNWLIRRIAFDPQE
ncbi:hypothetical protein HYALB_00000467 [Hymenoscyphus albidus]|uniref:Uncharacterized protein n=1 Tax=Hymenoscyphus albidus TaxID=595503 RepID=A0A9N9Q4X8_9HELO|nr:hypothetical protein HYALB_00000467 [Hymenoscyphus albidus]